MEKKNMEIMSHMLRSKAAFLLFGILALCFAGCEPEEVKPEIPQGFDPVIHFNEAIEYGSMTDIDGNEYKTFTVTRPKKDYTILQAADGSDSIVIEITYVEQTWMAENLRTKRYRNGDPIEYVNDSLEWGNISTAAYCTYNNTENADSIRVYGNLYNSYAVTHESELAPEGWHVADTMDWRMFFDTTALASGYLSFEGGKLKEAGYYHWRDLNYGATNETGFTAIPSGFREAYTRTEGNAFVKTSRFDGMGESVVYWTPNRKSSTTYQGVTLLGAGKGCHGVSPFKPLYYNRKHGFSVRCVKDY